MKKYFFLISCLFPILLSFYACKQDKWIEWKTMNVAWLEKHLATDPDNIKVSTSGLQYRIIDDPNKSEARPNSNSIVMCSYELRLIDGTLIEKVTNGIISLNQTIDGFAEGLKYIHVHGDIEIWIPYELGYGADGNGTEGYPSFIPPYSTLHFKIHLANASSDL